MIYKNGKEITGIRFGNRVITAVYIGEKLVWKAKTVVQADNAK